MRHLAYTIPLLCLGCQQPSAPATPEVPPAAQPNQQEPTVDAELAIRCWTAAMQKLGWLPVGAHTGEFMKTAYDAGLVDRACEPLTADAHQSGFALHGGGTLHWSREKTERVGQSVEVTIRFYCPEGECTSSEDRVIVLPGAWHCLGWVHGPDHGSECFRSASACEAGRKAWEIEARPTTDCQNEGGAAYCSPKTKKCYPGPWDCTREAGGTIQDGGCVRTDR